MLHYSIPRFRGVRRNDHKDAREFFNEFGAALRSVYDRFGPQAARRVGFEVDLDQPGLINGPAPVQSSGLINGPVTAPTGSCSNGDSAHETDPSCPPRKHCGEDALAFQSRGLPGFPLIGNGDFVERVLQVTPRVQEVKPYAIYWAAFDANQGYAPLRVAEMSSAVVGLEPQLLSPGMVASVFSDIGERIPVTWKSITPQLPLELGFGHPLPATVHMHVYGVIWAEVTRR